LKSARITIDLEDAVLEIQTYSAFKTYGYSTTGGNLTSSSSGLGTYSSSSLS
jgi:hypothetical protein